MTSVKSKLFAVKKNAPHRSGCGALESAGSRLHVRALLVRVGSDRLAGLQLAGSVSEFGESLHQTVDRGLVGVDRLHHPRVPALRRWRNPMMRAVFSRWGWWPMSDGNRRRTVG